MKNTITIHSDDSNVYITSSVYTNKTAKILLTAANIGVVLLHAFFIFEIEIHEVKRLLIPTCVSLVVFIVLPWRYWLWRFYGKENLSINKDTLSYSYDYGAFKTKTYTIPHTNLGTAFELVKRIDNEECGNFHFLSDDPKTKKRHYIHETIVVLPKKELININTHLSAIINSSQQPKVA